MKTALRIHLPNLVTAAVLVITTSLSASTAYSPEPVSRLQAGLDVTVEGATSLRTGAQRGNALHAMAVGHVSWMPAGKPGRALHFQTYASTLTLTGRGPTGAFLNDFLGASNIEGFASTRLYSWWGEAGLGQWSLRAGALLADEEFAGTETGGNLVNSGFGWPAFISANTINTGPAFYVAAPGVRLARQFGETAVWRVGIFDGDAFDSTEGDPTLTRHGLHYRVGGDQGYFVISEASFAPRESANIFKAGGWYHTAKFADVRDDANGLPMVETGGDPRLHRGNHGVYAAAERNLAGRPGEAGNVTGHIRGGFSPSDRNTLGYAIDVGLAATGLIPGRKDDITAVGVIQASFSPRFAANARASEPAQPAPDFEQVLEVSHSITLSEHLTLQPDFQYIRHPGGSAAQRDALVVLLRINASY